MKDCPDCMTDEDAVGPGTRCAQHNALYLMGQITALESEVESLRGELAKAKCGACGELSIHGNCGEGEVNAPGPDTYDECGSCTHSPAYHDILSGCRAWNPDEADYLCACKGWKQGVHVVVNPVEPLPDKYWTE